MKLINREDFLKIDFPVIYVEIDENYIVLNSPCIKWQTLHSLDDFYKSDLIDVKSEKGLNNESLILEYLKTHNNLTIDPKLIMRGNRDDSSIFYLVLEKEDLHILIDCFTNLLTTYKDI